jgi:hypothetical protein
MNADSSLRQCRFCVHFSNDPAAIEAAIPGLAAMSSAYASVRGDDGLCDLRAIYLTAYSTCGDFTPRPR